jgi:hypothetical protein
VRNATQLGEHHKAYCQTAHELVARTLCGTISIRRASTRSYAPSRATTQRNRIVILEYTQRRQWDFVRGINYVTHRTSCSRIAKREASLYASHHPMACRGPHLCPHKQSLDSSSVIIRCLRAQDKNTLPPFQINPPLQQHQIGGGMVTMPCR